MKRLALTAALLCVPATSQAQVTFFNDTFTDTAATSLTSHSPNTGGPWVKTAGPAGGWAISNANRVRANDIFWMAFSGTTVAPSADATITGVIRRITNVNYIGVGGRGNTSDARLYGCLLGTGTLYLQELDSIAGNTELGSYAASLADNTDYTVKLTMVGTTLKCFLDGVERISATDATLASAGTVAMFSFNPGGNPVSTNTTDFHVDSVLGETDARCRGGLLLGGAGSC